MAVKDIRLSVYDEMRSSKVACGSGNERRFKHQNEYKKVKTSNFSITVMLFFKLLHSFFNAVSNVHFI